MNVRLSVFQFEDYKKFLKALVELPETERGYVRRLAEAAGCQSSYLSAVFHGHVHLTPDHALGLCEFWKLPPAETEYFCLLVDLERSGTARLKSRIKGKLEALKDEHENLARRLERPELEVTRDGAMYYSSWLWSAVHILVSIPRFQSARACAARLGLAEEHVTGILRALEAMGLVKRGSQGGRWMHASGSVHVPKNSPWVALHHNNWRSRAVLHAQTQAETGVHFTTVTAVSADARRQIKELVLKFIEESNAVAEPSPAEELICLTLDLFQP